MSPTKRTGLACLFPLRQRFGSLWARWKRFPCHISYQTDGLTRPHRFETAILITVGRGGSCFRVTFPTKRTGSPPLPFRLEAAIRIIGGRGGRWFWGPSPTKRTARAAFLHLLDSG